MSKLISETQRAHPEASRPSRVIEMIAVIGLTFGISLASLHGTSAGPAYEYRVVMADSVAATPPSYFPARFAVPVGGVEEIPPTF